MTFRAFGAGTGIRSAFDEHPLAFVRHPVGVVEPPVGVGLDAGDCGVGALLLANQVQAQPVSLGSRLGCGPFTRVRPGQGGVSGRGGGSHGLDGFLPGVRECGRGFAARRCDGCVRHLTGLADFRVRLLSDLRDPGVGVAPHRTEGRCGFGLDGVKGCSRLVTGRGMHVAFGLQTDPLLVELVHGCYRLGGDRFGLDPGCLRTAGGLLGPDRPGDGFGDPLGGFRLHRLDTGFRSRNIAKSRHFVDETVQRAGEPGGQRRDLPRQRVGSWTCAAGEPGGGRCRTHRRGGGGYTGNVPPPTVGGESVVCGVIAVRGRPSRPDRSTRWLGAPRVCACGRIGLVDHHTLGHDSAHRPFQIP